MVALVRLRRLAGAAAIVAAGLLAAPTAVVGQAEAPRPELPLLPETRTAIQRLADSLRAARVPAGPLYDKAAEGVLKGADDMRILRAVRSLAGELVAARAALGATANDAEILAGASALHAGVPDDALRQLAAFRGKRGAASLAVPLTVLADLVTRRVPPDVAAESVEALMLRGAADDTFAALRAEVQRDILSGTAPAAAASARTRALIQAGGRPEPPGGGPLP